MWMISRTNDLMEIRPILKYRNDAWSKPIEFQNSTLKISEVI